MLGLAIVMFIAAALMIFFAVQSKLAFFLDEGWKFRETTEPSDLYVGVNGIKGFVVAAVAIFVGIGACGQHVSEQNTAKAQAAATAAHQRCETEILPRFNDTIKWDGPLVSNPDELHALAQELGVEVEIERKMDFRTHAPADDVGINDPAKPRQDKRVFTYFGWASDHGTPDECYDYTPERH
jgi:hypothetical protein